MKLNRRRFLVRSAALGGLALAGPSLLLRGQAGITPFGADHPELEITTTGEWWTIKPPAPDAPPVRKRTASGGEVPFLDLNVPRDQVVAFALYTHDHGVLKLSAHFSHSSPASRVPPGLN